MEKMEKKKKIWKGENKPSGEEREKKKKQQQKELKNVGRTKAVLRQEEENHRKVMAVIMAFSRKFKHPFPLPTASMVIIIQLQSPNPFFHSLYKNPFSSSSLLTIPFPHFPFLFLPKVRFPSHSFFLFLLTIFFFPPFSNPESPEDFFLDHSSFYFSCLILCT